MLASQLVSNLHEAKDVEKKWNSTADMYKTPRKANWPHTGANDNTTHLGKWQETVSMMEMSALSAETLVTFEGDDGLANAVKEMVSKFSDLDTYLSKQALDLDFMLEDVAHHVELLENLA